MLDVPAEGTLSDHVRRDATGRPTPTGRRTRCATRRTRIDGPGVRPARRRTWCSAPARAPGRSASDCSRRSPRTTILDARRSRRRGRRRHLRPPEPRVGRPRTAPRRWAASGGRRTCRPSSSRWPDAFHGDIGITSALLPDQDCTAVAGGVRGGADRAASPSSTDERLGGGHLLHPHARRAGACATPTTATSGPAPRLFERGRLRGLPHADAARPATGRRRRRSPTRRSTRTPTCCCTTWARASPTAAPTSRRSGREWRTPPLWGIGLVDEVNGHRFLLHDGRARTLEEAILWHGGEGEASREAFRTASAEDRARLIAFLEAL